MQDSTIAIIIIVIMAVYVLANTYIKFKPHFEIVLNYRSKYLVFSYYNLSGEKVSKVLFKYAK